HRRPRLRRLRPGGADALPVRRGAGAPGRGVRGGPLPATPGRGDGAHHRRRREALPRTHAAQPPAHPAGRLLPLRAPAAHRGAARRPAPRRGARTGPRTRPAIHPATGPAMNATPGATPASSRADARRTALLHALDDLLREAVLDDIKIADISSRAGVTRSAFYFYFDSKAAAVAALMSEV